MPFSNIETKKSDKEIKESDNVGNDTVKHENSVLEEFADLFFYLYNLIDIKFIGILCFISLLVIIWNQNNIIKEIERSSYISGSVSIRNFPRHFDVTVDNESYNPVPVKVR